MSEYMVKFEDTTKNPDRTFNGTSSLGLPIELLPSNLNIYGKQFFDESCKYLSGVLVDYDAAITLREVAVKNGTIAWVRDCSESSYKKSWQETTTLCGRQAFTVSNITIKTSLELLSQYLQERIKKDHEAYEKFIESVPLSLVRELYDFQTNTGLITKSVESTTSLLPLTIMTYIAIGEEFGGDLEKVFPEHKNANPIYAFTE